MKNIKKLLLNDPSGFSPEGDTSDYVDGDDHNWNNGLVGNEQSTGLHDVYIFPDEMKTGTNTTGGEIKEVVISGFDSDGINGNKDDRAGVDQRDGFAEMLDNYGGGFTDILGAKSQIDAMSSYRFGTSSQSASQITVANASRMHNIANGAKIAGNVLNFIPVAVTAYNNGIQSNSTKIAAVSAAGSWAGGELVGAGATAGAAIGVWFFGVGAVPGAAIGAAASAVGAIVGGLYGGDVGQSFGEYLFN